MILELENLSLPKMSGEEVERFIGEPSMSRDAEILDRMVERLESLQPAALDDLVDMMTMPPSLR